MPIVTLSSVVRDRPQVINASLEKLSCSSLGIDEVDVYPAVLSALTAKAAPRSVTDSVRAVTQARAPHSPLQPQPLPGSRATKKPQGEDSYMETFNVGIAMSLHTVLLSRNRLTSLLGVVQFKHCVRLSLLGNRIRTVEDCEPLSLLPDLQFLSLEFNPVAQLPHYRAHLLRICAWPHELSTRTCRLRKLDSAAVTSAEIRHAVLCLHREMALMPELRYRVQLLAFVADMEKKAKVHDELRRRGVVHQQPPTAATVVAAALERGAQYALDRLPVSGAAHLVRLVVRDRHRLLTSGQLSKQSRGTPGRESAAHEPPAKTRPGAVDASTIPLASASLLSSDELDERRDVSLSSVHTCSLASDQSECGAQVLHSLSHLLGGSGELEWSRAALRRADTTAARETCTEWSNDGFRQTLAYLDVRICAGLLRVARAQGATLNAHDVDSLCQLWLHAVTHHTHTTEETLNVTGPRRVVLPRKPTVSPRPVQQQQRSRPTDVASAGGVQAGTPAVPAPPTPCVVAANALGIRDGTHCGPTRSIWAVGERDGCLSRTSSTTSLPPTAASSDITVDCTDITAASLSSDSLVMPRQAAPQPTEGSHHCSEDTRRSKQREEGTAEVLVGSIGAVSHPQPAHVPGAPHSSADAMAATRGKRAAFQQWCTALRHRWQSRLAVSYVEDKISDATTHARAPLLRSPSWSGLLTHVTYIERKRGFFNLWRRRAETRAAWRALEVDRLAQLRHTQLARKAQRVMQTEVEPGVAALSPAELVQSLFTLWKTRAERRAARRCLAARQRVCGDSPATPDTFLTLHRHSSAGRRPAAPTPTSALRAEHEVPRRLLQDLLASRDGHTAAEEAAAVESSPAPPSLSPLGFRRCTVTGGSAVKLTVWRTAKRPSLPPSPEACATASASSGSAGISLNSATTTPFEQPESRPAQQRGGAVADSPSHSWSAPRHGGAPLRELSPPPAIRILFPAEKGSADTPPHVVSATTVRAAAASSCGTHRLRSGDSAQPRRLPSTAAARRAILQRADAPPGYKAPAGGVQKACGGVRRPLPSQGSESPYPAEAVEALVERAKELEADRAFLLAEVQKLTAAMPSGGEACSATPAGDWRGPSVQSSHHIPRVQRNDSTDKNCERQEREIRRLESIVAALRDERHQLLRSIKPEVFQY